MQVKRGDIYWLEPSEAEASAGAVPHPHVVIQDDLFNNSRLDTVVMCALTSNLTRAKEPGNVLLDPGEGALVKRSVILVAQISSVPKARLGQYVGTLSSLRVEQILTGLRFIQASFLQGR